jgi:hypothetical protein|tara:strand:- start:242 stop:469 length:228 start_codon:yes stop_codon:yes gene_type:complete
MEKKKCVNCEADNSEGWFYCRTCGEKASESKYSVQFVIRDGNPWATAIRKDLVDFRSEPMQDSIKRMRKQKWGTA